MTGGSADCQTNRKIESNSRICDIRIVSRCDVFDPKVAIFEREGSHETDTRRSTASFRNPTRARAFRILFRVTHYKRGAREAKRNENERKKKKKRNRTKEREREKKNARFVTHDVMLIRAIHHETARTVGRN